MGTVSGNWITGTHRGRACRHENLYTKVNKKTGKCYSVKLCNPNDSWTEKQEAVRKAFSVIQTCIADWISENKVATGSANADYLKVLARYNVQNKYATLRGFMLAKGMYTVSSDGTVSVDISANTDFKGVTETISGSSSSTTTGGTTTGGSTDSGSSSQQSGGSSDTTPEVTGE